MVEKKLSNTSSEQTINKEINRGVFRTTHIIVSVVCLASLIFSLWPGAMASFILAITAIFWIPVLLFLVIYNIFKIFITFCKNKDEAKVLSYRFGLHVLVVSCTFAILTFNIPLKIAFCISKSNFDLFLKENQSDIKISVYDKSINKKIGIWKVDHCLKDSRGGTYFRIGNELNMIDTISYGFAFNPNDEETPFGGVEYKTRIIGDWYFFCASDD